MYAPTPSVLYPRLLTKTQRRKAAIFIIIVTEVNESLHQGCYQDAQEYYVNMIDYLSKTGPRFVAEPLCMHSLTFCASHTHTRTAQVLKENLYFTQLHKGKKDSHN